LLLSLSLVPDPLNKENVQNQKQRQKTEEEEEDK
jgi:hypothetical protein